MRRIIAGYLRRYADLTVPIIRLFLPALIRMFVLDQLPGLDVEIPAQFTDEHSIDPLKIITAVPVEIGTRNIQIFTDLIFADAFGL